MLWIRRFLFFLSLSAAALFAACDRASSGDPLYIISPHPETLLEEFEAAFRPWYRAQTGRGADCIWLDQGGTSRMLLYLDSEFKRQPGGINIDIIWGGGVAPYFQLESRGLLQPYRLPDPILSSIPADYNGLLLRDPNHRWYSTWLVGFGIIHNRRVLDLQRLPVPRTWADLTNPAYFSWVGSADPRQSGTAHMAYEIILQAHGWDRGWEIITWMGGNIKVFTRLSSDVPRDAALGEIACGLCMDNYAYSQMAFTGRDILGYEMPEGLTVVNPDGIGILKGAPHLETARRFVDYVLSEPGQRLIMAPVGHRDGPRRFQIARMSVRPDIYAALGDDRAVPVNPFEMKQSLAFDSGKLSARIKLVGDMIGAMIIENHDLLQEAWRAVSRVEPARREPLARRLAATPITEAESLSLSKTIWREDPVARNREMVRWSQFARANYEGVLREAEK